MPLTRPGRPTRAPHSDRKSLESGRSQWQSWPVSNSHVQLVTFHVPGSSSEPMEVRVSHSGLRMALVSRESIGLLDKSWKVLGVYFLLGAADDPDRYRAYVGEVGKSFLIQRVSQHAAKKDWWSRALLIASVSDDFNSAEIGWLEGRLYDVLNNAVACDVMNGNRPGDDSLSANERGILERYVEPIIAALRACGAPPDTADQRPPAKGKKKVTRYSETVSDLIAGGLLKPETNLQPLRKGLIQTARVLDDGRLEINGVIYESLSAAAKAVSGTVAEAGWDFWGAPSGSGGFVPLTQLRDRLRENGSKAASGNSTASDPIPAVPTPAPAAPPALKAAPTPAAATEKTPLAKAAAARPDLFPLTIFATYRGEKIEATIDSAGVIQVGEETFTSPSMAAGAARRQHGYTGAGKAETNGWTWWRFSPEDGTAQLLDQLRKMSL